ncbi:MAG: CBS domain-containing protein [Candidatus Eremiobacteraeota bacterium]|nr:CBS domain-containing protein [Candidatus Eremiobacteraeota bacterium]
MKVRDVMTQKVRTIEYSASVRELSRLLDELGISGVPVVDADGRLVGVVSSTDIGSGVSDPPVASEMDRDLLDEDHELAGLESAKVADLMTEHVVTIDPSANVTELVDLMVDSNIHRVFVTSGEELVGVVTTMDLIRQLKSMFSQMSNV